MTVNRNNISLSLNSAPEEANLLALKQWTDHHKPLLEVFIDAYCVVDLRGKVIEFNEAFTELCGESYKKILKIGNFCDLVKTELCPAQCPATQIFTSEKTLRLDELKGASRAYPELQMILSGVPIFSDTKQLLGSLITIRNVSAESELQKKYDERKRDSITDGLTRLFNKVYTENVLLRSLKSCMRDGHPLSILLCDIDHFKKINDNYGHQAGDYVLALVAQMLKGESRESDIVGRFGGEEFMVVMQNTDETGARIFAERFRNRVETTVFTFSGKKMPVTVSCGTASFKDKWNPSYVAEALCKEIINKADTALYYAKANGRNQTWQFENLPAASSKEIKEKK